jgi:hypothetical protein
MATRPEHPLGLARDTAAPIDQCAEDIEEEGFDGRGQVKLMIEAEA